MDDRAHSGYTLVELVVTLAALAILVTWAVPAFSNLIDSNRLRAAAAQLAGDLRYARSEAIKHPSSTPVGVSFSPGERWCYGISQQLPCDCRQTDWRRTDACLLDLSRERQLHTAAGTAHPGIRLLEARFSGGAVTAFDPTRGIARAGSITLESQRGKRVDIRISTLGRVRICTPDGDAGLGGYSAC